jgi:hypothetical protein
MDQNLVASKDYFSGNLDCFSPFDRFIDICESMPGWIVQTNFNSSDPTVTVIIKYIGIYVSTVMQ